MNNLKQNLYAFMHTAEGSATADPMQCIIVCQCIVGDLTALNSIQRVNNT